MAAAVLVFGVLAPPASAEEHGIEAECNGEDVLVEFRGGDRSEGAVGFIDGRPIVAIGFAGELFMEGDTEPIDTFEERRGRGVPERMLTTCEIVFEFEEVGMQFRGEVTVTAIRPGSGLRP